MGGLHAVKKVGDGASADPPPSGALAAHEHHEMQEVHATVATLHETTLAHPVGPHPNADTDAHAHAAIAGAMAQGVNGGAHGASHAASAHHDVHAKPAPIDPKIQEMIDKVNAINADLLHKTNEIKAQEELKKQQKTALDTAKAVGIAAQLGMLSRNMSDSGSKAFIQQLDQLDDPDLRHKVMEQFKLQTGEDIKAFIARNKDWNNNGENRDAKAALQLVSDDRDKADADIAALDPKKRADMEKEANDAAIQILASTNAHDHSDENMQKIFKALGHRSPAEIEMIRAAVRKHTNGESNLYQSIDNGTHKGDEDEAVAMLAGKPVDSARAALANETDPKRLREIVGALDENEIKEFNRDPFFKTQVLARCANPADRAELAAAMNDDKVTADAEHLGNLLKPKKEGEVNGAFNVYDKVDQDNYDRRKPANVIKEFEAMSGEQVKAAAAAWDKAHPGEKSFEQMLEARWGDDDDKTELRRLQAMIKGDKGLNRSIRLQEGLREDDQKEIEAALAHETVNDKDPDLKSEDEKKRTAAEDKAKRIIAENNSFEAANVADDKATQGVHAIWTGHNPADVKGRSTKDQLTAYYDAQEKKDIGSNFAERYVGGKAGEDIHKARQDAHDMEVKDHRAGAMDMLEDGHLSTAVEMYRGDSAKDKLEAVEKVKTNKELEEQEKKYEHVYGKPMFKASDKSERDDMSTAELQLDNVRRYGAKAERPADLEYRLQAQVYKHSYSKSLEESEAYEAGGGTQNWERQELAAEAKMLKDPRVTISGPTIVTDKMGIKHAVDDPHEESEQQIQDGLPDMIERPRPDLGKAADDGLKDGITKEQFNQQDAGMTAAASAQQEAKKRMAERLIKIFATIAKIAAALTLQPELIAAIDIAEGVLEIIIKKEIIGKDYSMSHDLKMLAITGVADVAMMGFAKYGKGAAQVAEKAALEEAEKVVVKEATSEIEHVAVNEAESQIVHQGTSEVENVAKSEIEQKVTQGAENKVAGEMEGQAAKTVEKEVAQEVEKDAVKATENAAETAAKEQLSPAAIGKQIEARWGIYGNAAKMIVQTVGGGIANGQSPLEIIRGLATGGAGLIIPGALGEKIRGAIGNETAAAKLLGEVFGTSAEYMSALTINVAGGADPADAAWDTAIGVGGGRLQHAMGGHGGGGAKPEESTSAPERTSSPEPTSAPEPSTAREPTVAPELTSTATPERTIAPEILTPSEPIVAREPVATREPVAAPEPGPARPVEEAQLETRAAGREDTVAGATSPGVVPEKGTSAYRSGKNSERTVARAGETLDAMEPAVRAQHETLLANAESPVHKAMLERAIAAGHTFEEVNTLNDAMKAMGPDEVIREFSGHGLAQGFQQTCVPTSYQIAIAEVDPVYALHLKNNPEEMVAAQGTAVQIGGGEVTQRGDLHRPNEALRAVMDDPAARAVIKKEPGTMFEQIEPLDSDRTGGIEATQMQDQHLHKVLEKVTGTPYEVITNQAAPHDRAGAGEFDNARLPHDRIGRALDNNQPVLIGTQMGGGAHERTIVGREIGPNGEITYLITDPHDGTTGRWDAAAFEALPAISITLPAEAAPPVTAPAETTAPGPASMETRAGGRSSEESLPGRTEESPRDQLKILDRGFGDELATPSFKERREKINRMKGEDQAREIALLRNDVAHMRTMSNEERTAGFGAQNDKLQAEAAQLATQFDMNPSDAVKDLTRVFEGKQPTSAMLEDPGYRAAWLRAHDRLAGEMGSSVMPEIREKTAADTKVKGKLENQAEKIADQRDADEMATLKNGRAMAADAAHNEVSQGAEAVGKNKTTFKRANDIAGVIVRETAFTEKNLFIDGAGRYTEFTEKMNTFGEEFGIPPDELVNHFVEFTKTGKVPKVSRDPARQAEFAKVIANMERVLFTSEVLRSGTQLSDLTITFDIMMDPNSEFYGQFEALDLLMPTAFGPGENQAGQNRAGGAPGASGAVDFAGGVPMPGNSAKRRATDEAIMRHIQLLELDPQMRALDPKERERIMVQRIRGMLAS